MRFSSVVISKRSKNFPAEPAIWAILGPPKMGGGGPWSDRHPAPPGGGPKIKKKPGSQQYFFFTNIYKYLVPGANPLPIRRLVLAEPRQIVAESLAFRTLCVNYTVKYIGAEGTGDLTSGLKKMVLFIFTLQSLFSKFLVHSAFKIF